MRESKIKHQELLERILKKNQCYYKKGKVATYIPALSKAFPEEVGIFIKEVNGNTYSAGSFNKKFTLQSISKVISLILAMMDNGRDVVVQKVGVEPTSEPFNAIGKAQNPMQNSGAILTTSLIKGNNALDKIERLLNITRELSDNKHLKINEDIYISEKNTGNMNKAIAYYLKAMGLLEIKVEDALDVYFKQCSIEVTCKDLANIAAILANNGRDLKTGKSLVTKDIVTSVLAIMTTCGLYNGSGKFLVNVGIPAKSGVSGGIMAVVPGKMGIGVYSPALDENGNSVVGMKILEELSKSLKLNIFSTM